MTVLALTAFADVMEHLRRDDTELTDQAYITQLALAWSSAIESWCGRRFMSESRVEDFDADAEQNVFQLLAWPVTSVTSVKISADYDWATATTLDSTSYYTDTRGRLWLKQGVGFAGDNVLRVTYVGGLTTTTALLKASFADLHLAATMQVGYALQRRHDIGSNSRSQGGQSQSWDGALELAPAVKLLVSAYRRFGIA